MIKLPQDPIFIVGYPRSGTTLLQALLATQDGVYTLPETHFFNVVYEEIKTDKNDAIEFSCLDAVFDKIKEKMELEFAPTEIDAIKLLSKAKELQPKLLFEFIVSHYLERELNRSDFSHSYRWMEKTPNHAYYLDEIFSLYPGAQFINIIRNPVAAINSRKNRFPYNKDTPVEKLAHLWMKSVDSFETFNRQHPEKMYSLRYEDLVADPAKELEEIGRFLKIDTNLDLLSEYKDVSKNFIHDWETWKGKVKSNEISNYNTNYKLELPLSDILKIQSILRKKMMKYRYRLSKPVLQKFFDLGKKFQFGESRI
jgi:hypothetical protein